MKYVFLFIISLNCFADDWSEADTQREITYLALHSVDWAQTLRINRTPGMEEGGLIARAVIGPHPTNSQVNRYMIGSAILQYAIADILPHEYRTLFQYVAIVDSGVSVVWNFRIGL